MGVSARAYREQLQALLPRGTAWPRDEGATLTRFLAALAEEFARVDGRGEDLTVEANPATTAELLPDWERVAGLPDPCVGEVEPTLQGRRNALVSKLGSSGSASIPYFIALAAALGFVVSITEFRPFCAGVSCAGDELTDGDWLHTWRVNAPETTITDFTAGYSCAGDPLASWGNALLECRISNLKPAHTIVQFAYGVPLLLLLEGVPLSMLDGESVALTGGYA